MNEIAQLKKFGLVFDGYKSIITKSNASQLAMDAQLLTPANAGVPVEFTSYIDENIIRIVTAPVRARQIGTERKVGDWTTSQMRFPMIEQTGFTQPYDDFANNGKSDVNATFPARENYVFETTIDYGDREAEIAGRARINLVSEKQRSAATTLDLAMNRFYFYGVSGLQNFGLLNDPRLRAALTPTEGAGGSPLWVSKSTIEIYNDILRMVADLQTRSQGLIDENSSMVLVVPPEVSAYLLKATDYNVSVKTMLAESLPNLRIVVAPELATTGGNLVQLYAETVTYEGGETRTVDLIFSEKMRAMRIVPGESSYRQKFVAGTFGAVIFQPFAVSQMLGV